MGKIDESYNLQSPLQLKIEWGRINNTPPLALSISALLLNAYSGVVDKFEDFVFYGSTSTDGKKITSPDGGIMCDTLLRKGFGTSGDYCMTIDLDKINTEVNKIRVVASIDAKGKEDWDTVGFDTLSKAEFTLMDSAGKTYQCNLEKESDSRCRSVDVAIVQRWDKNWRFVEELTFHMGGLDMIYCDDSYVSDLVSIENPFEECGDIVKIEETWKKTEMTTRIGRTGQKIRKTVTKVVEAVTEVLGMDEDERDYKQNILNRKVSHTGSEQLPKKQVKPKPKEVRLQRPKIKRLPHTATPKEQKPLEINPVVDVSHPRGRIIKRSLGKVDAGKIDSEPISGGDPIASDANINRKTSKRHPIVKRK